MAAGKVQNMGELIESDPQHAARSFWQPVNHAFWGERLSDTHPSLWDGTRPAIDLLAPAYLGEHNFDVYTELAGMSDEDVATAMAEGLFS